MSVRGYSVIVALVVISAIGLGCGGGTETLSKAQFIKQADAACNKADQGQLTAMTRVPISGNRYSRANEEKVIVDGALPPVQVEAEEIAELGSPAGDEKEVAAIVKGIEDGVAKAEKDPLHGLAKAFVEVGKRAAKYGLKACAEPL